MQQIFVEWAHNFELSQICFRYAHNFRGLIRYKVLDFYMPTAPSGTKFLKSTA